MPAYEYKHVVGFEETSLAGNVYFTNYLLWQGHCREMFLRDHAPDVLAPLARREIAFFTRRCACEYIGDWGFSALDEVRIDMRLARFRGGRMALEFTYAHSEQPDVPVATGSQEVYCKAARGEQWIAEPFPPPMLKALLAFADREDLRAALEEALAFHEQLKHDQR